MTVISRVKKASLFLASCLCTLTLPTLAANAQEAPQAKPQTVNPINHIIFMAQENRSLDNYLGALRQYWAQNGYPDQSFDGLPQFNPTTGVAPIQGPPPSNPGCNSSSPAPGNCIPDPSNPVKSFHLSTMCTENTSPSWDEAHNDWDYNDPVDRKSTRQNSSHLVISYAV